MDKSKINSLGYKVGYFLAIVTALCVVAMLVGLTAKFLFWLF